MREVIGKQLPDSRPGVFIRRKDGIFVEVTGKVWMFEQLEDGNPLGLMRYDDGQIQESYHVPDKARASVYLAAIAQGFEPPRGLKNQDKPVG
jgi:hypothetical protein